MSAKVAEDISTREVINPQASNSIEKVEFKALRIDRAEVQDSISVEVAEDISTREVINLASNFIEEVEFKAHKMDGAEVQVSMSVEVAPDISTREMVIQQGDQHEGVMVQEVVIKPVNTAQPAIQQGD